MTVRWVRTALSCVVATLTLTGALGAPAAAGSDTAAADDSAQTSDWTEITHEHISGQDSYLFDSWSTDDTVWHAGTRRAYVGGTYEWRTLVQRCSGSSCQAMYPRDLEAPPYTYNSLQGISGTSASDVWVVGAARYAGPPAATRPVIHHWNGSSWTIVANPVASGALYGVSAKAPDDVWAVGYSYADFTQTPIVLHWDGASWTDTGFSVPGCTPYDLAEDILAEGRRPIVIGECRADGGQPEAMIAVLRAGGWTRAVVPGIDAHESEFWAVSKVGKQVWVGGATAGSTLAVRLKGGRWQVEPTPVPGTVQGMAGSGPRDVWAVGFTPSSQRLTMHWNGRRWRGVDASTDAGWFETVAITASGRPWAAGQEGGQSLIARYDGPLGQAGGTSAILPSRKASTNSS